jgi:hypothetical protein
LKDPMTETLKLATILAADGFGYSRPAKANEDRTPARLLGPSLSFPSNAPVAGGPQLPNSAAASGSAAR